MSKRGLWLTSLAALAVALVFAVRGATPAYAQGGPIILMGIDAEDCGPGGHGPVSVYRDVVDSLLDSASKSGTSSDILVLGGDPGGLQNFWTALAAIAPALSVTFAPDASDISSESFSSYRLVVVSSSLLETCGGMTQAELDEVNERADDIAAHINGGGGLLVFGHCDLTGAYDFLGEIGAATCTSVDYDDITATSEGTAVGITDALDICCWHNTFETYPSFLEVLAIDAVGEGVAAVGGSDVTIGPAQTVRVPTPRPQLGPAAGPIVAAITTGVENSQQTLGPDPTAVGIAPPSTGTGVITPPSTGDAGLNDSGSSSVALIGAIVLVGLVVLAAGRRLVYLGRG